MEMATEAVDKETGLDAKLLKLDDILTEMGKVAVALSGGIDSTFLLARAHEVLGDNAIGITVTTPLVPESDIAFTQDFCEEFGIKQLLIEVDALGCADVRENPPDRCYYCKKMDMGAVMEAAREIGAVACDGMNIDDADDYRPGTKATSELGMRSPLAEAGFTKSDIRMAAKDMGLSIWDKPASACLASRIPYGTPLDAETLRRIGKAEELLREKGFRQVRVRVHDNGDLARIEVPADQVAKLCDDPICTDIVDGLKALGFKYVSCDMQGYRMGSLNEQLEI